MSQLPARELRWLKRAARREGRRLARRVTRGQLTRAQVEDAARMYPDDAEPKLALQWLDEWGIR